MTAFPRHELDIGWSDLGGALASRPSHAEAAQLRRRIVAGWAPDPAVVCLSVRTAFDLLLRAMRLPPGSEVAMSAINVPQMAEIVRQHGLVSVPLDIAPDTLLPDPAELHAKLSTECRLVLIAHLFGAVSPIDELAEACRARNLLLVEDCAQAWDGVFKGSPLADVSLFSFGPIKRGTALGGAVAAFRNAELAEIVAKLEAAYPCLSDGWFVRRVLKYAGLKALSLGWPYACALRLLQALGRDPDATLGELARNFRAGDMLPQLRRRPPPRLLALLNRRLSRPAAARYEAHALRAKRLVASLPVALETPGARAARHKHWLTPLLHDRPAELVAALRPAGFDATRGATSLRALEPASMAPRAHDLLRRIVYLPVTGRLTEAAGRRLAQMLASFMSAPAGAKPSGAPASVTVEP